MIVLTCNSAFHTVLTCPQASEHEMQQHHPLALFFNKINFVEKYIPTKSWIFRILWIKYIPTKSWTFRILWIKYFPTNSWTFILKKKKVHWLSCLKRKCIWEYKIEGSLLKTFYNNSDEKEELLKVGDALYNLSIWLHFFVPLRKR